MLTPPPICALVSRSSYRHRKLKSLNSLVASVSVLPFPYFGFRTSASVVNGFSDQGEFEAMKTLSDWEAARCDEHQFCAKIKVGVFELSLFDK